MARFIVAKWPIVALCTVSMWVITHSVQAADFFNDYISISGETPAVGLRDDVGTPQSWEISADDVTFRIRYRRENPPTRPPFEPFVVESQAPDNAIRIGNADGSGDANIGIGGDPEIDINLHLFEGSDPTIRFQQTGTPYRWDLQGDESDFLLQDVTGGSIPFRVETDCPDDALRIRADSFGDPNIGFGGTAATDVNLHIFEDSQPQIRLDQTGSNPYRWDLQSSHTSFTLQDVSNSNRRPFVVDSGCATNSLHMSPGGDGNGNLGLGTASPGFPLHVVRGDVPTTTIAKFQQTSVNKPVLVQFQNTAPASTSNSCGFDYLLNDAGSGKIVGRFVCSLVDTTAGSATAAMQFQVMDNGATAQAMKIQGNRVSIGTNQSTDLLRVLNATCNGATWNNACSRELKQDIADLSTDEALQTLEQLNPVTYAYRAKPDEPRVGFIAEDVPQRVALADGKSLSSMDIVAVLTKIVQEQGQQLVDQAAQLEAKDRELEQLQKHVIAQDARLEKQEAALAAIVMRLRDLDGKKLTVAAAD